MSRVAGVVVAVLLFALPFAAVAGADDKRLDVYWIDVEGGAATLIVTPAGESILVDVGNPGGRDAARIHKVATEVAKLKTIDHLIVTHLHVDHYGGLAELAALMPVGTLYENGVETAPEGERNHPQVKNYLDAKVGKRVRIQPGLTLPLLPVPGLKVTVLGGRQAFGPARGPRNAACAKVQPGQADRSDNANSVVTLVQLGRFQFFDGGDLTWNTEAELVCPRDRVGAVDVYQSNHHGQDNSNNPVLVSTLAPTVTVINNGARKGGGPGTFAALKKSPRIQAIYQVHRNLAEPEANTEPAMIANAADPCTAGHIALSVDPRGKSYTVSVPSTGHLRTFKTR